MKGVGYARHQSPLKEVSDAHHTHPDDTGFAPVRATFLHARLPARSAAPGWRFSAVPGARTVSSALRAMGLDPQAGCRALRTGPATQTGPDRKASPQGRALAEPFGGGRRPENRLEVHHARQLVRRNRANVR